MWVLAMGPPTLFLHLSLLSEIIESSNPGIEKRKVILTGKAVLPLEGEDLPWLVKQPRAYACSTVSCLLRDWALALVQP